MRVIITGGSGMIGRALTENLVAAGHEVIILSRDPSRARDIPAGARAERWDGNTARGWDHLVADAGIINLAGENISKGRWTAERKRRIRESRVNAGRAVVEAVRSASAKPQVLIQGSAVGYYGSRGDEELREDNLPGDDFLSRVCVHWEASSKAVEEMGVRRVIIRTAPVLHAKDGALPRMMLPYRFFVGGPLGSGRQWFPWIHIDDEVAAIGYLLENQDACGPFNLASPDPITNNEFSEALGRAMGRPSAMPVPALALRLIFGELGDSLLHSERVIPQRLLDIGFKHRFNDPEAALRDLLA